MSGRSTARSLTRTTRSTTAARSTAASPRYPLSRGHVRSALRAASASDRSTGGEETLICPEAEVGATRRDHHQRPEAGISDHANGDLRTLDLLLHQHRPGTLCMTAVAASATAVLSPRPVLTSPSSTLWTTAGTAASPPRESRSFLPQPRRRMLRRRPPASQRVCRVLPRVSPTGWDRPSPAGRSAARSPGKAGSLNPRPRHAPSSWRTTHYELVHEALPERTRARRPSRGPRA